MAQVLEGVRGAPCGMAALARDKSYTVIFDPAADVRVRTDLMCAYEQLSAEEKVRHAVRAAWFEMPQVWVDAMLPADHSRINLILA